MTDATLTTISFPEFTGIRCLMMPYIQGDPTSVPKAYAPYQEIIETVFIKKGDIGYLTIDESIALKGKPHRGTRSRYNRALHTEAGKIPNEKLYPWGSWGGRPNVLLDREVRVLLANNLDYSCAVWEAEHENTTIDGDIGHLSDAYPYSEAFLMTAGEVREIGIFTPHESMAVPCDFNRQFLRIVSSGVWGRESHFTHNPLLPMGSA